MAKKKEKQEALPGVDGPGVAPISIPEIDKAINKYERKKEARCVCPTSSQPTCQP